MLNKSFLEGKKIYLRPLTANDINDNYISWLNDSEVCKYNSHHAFPYNKHKAEEYLKNISLSKEILVLAIITKRSEKHIGNISLQQIDLLNSSAEFAILLGDKNYWGKGIAKEASVLIVNHGFKELNLHRIYCGTSSENIAMQKLAEFLGMSEEGRRKEAQFKNGRYNDILEFGILKKDFFKKCKN
ncbi:MAG: GNAT family protein [Patescibacteria group bacterium]